LEDIRPFEILRNQRDKANYLLVKEARIIAMTSTHAAMRRHEIAALGFHYDNVIMEEAAQLTEVENFIPLALQEPTISKDGKLVEKNLKRVVLVGDHLQNSPIVQNAAFKSYANLEQSLFLRLVRLGVPLTMLDAQGRARPSLAALYKWRYPHLTNLPITSTDPAFTRANAGLRYDFQFIDVPDYKGEGETEPSPHFIQNLGEAEYAVALYQYMRLLGYPASKISILASYAGQKALIRDVLGHRCKGNRLFGMPGWVGTVDKYQGEQNDYVILSLTRTKSAGYLRDLRRLTVALSRARLGLYVFGRREVFESSLELRQAFAGLFARSNTLALVPGEMFAASPESSERGVEDEVEATEMQGVEHLGQYVFEMTKAKVEDLKRGGGSLPAAEVEVQGRVEDDEEDEGADGEEEVVVVDGEGEVEMGDGGVL
jgi:intron-binding protein aquarius